MRKSRWVIREGGEVYVSSCIHPRQTPKAINNIRESGMKDEWEMVMGDMSVHDGRMEET